MRAPAAPIARGTLRELDLSGNRSLGGPALDALSNLVHEGVLRMLEATGLARGRRAGAWRCTAVRVRFGKPGV